MNPIAANDRVGAASRTGGLSELGMLRHIDEAKRVAALARVRLGRLYDLGRVIDEHVPVFPGRAFHQTLVTTAHHANAAEGTSGLGDNAVNWITEVFTATTQLGTHLDTLAHLQAGDQAYGGVRVSELAGTSGVRRLGAESVPQIVTTGWLVDVPAVRGVDVLGAGDVVRVEDLLESGIDPQRGDAVLFHTGWGRHWGEPERYLDGEPGVGLDLARWLAGRGVALTGADTWSYGPVPAEDPARPFEVPQTLSVRDGVFVVENLDTSALARDGVAGFALVVSFPKLRGATGAWTSPIALV